LPLESGVWNHQRSSRSFIHPNLESGRELLGFPRPANAHFWDKAYSSSDKNPGILHETSAELKGKSPKATPGKVFSLIR
jgi:hypothetical protein